MIVTLIVCGALLFVWILLNMKTSRPDAKLIPSIHPYRRMLPFIMQGRNESIVLFDSYVNAERLLAYIA